MEENYFKYETSKKGMGFFVALAALLVFTFMGIGVDVDQYLQHSELKIPQWYFYLIFSVDFFLLLSLVFIFFYKKLGVFIYPLMAALHFFFHMYYLNTFLYSDVFNLFIFFGLGLLFIIPKWKFFRWL